MLLQVRVRLLHGGLQGLALLFPRPLELGLLFRNGLNRGEVQGTVAD
jgi:hypothetical protein